MTNRINIEQVEQNKKRRYYLFNQSEHCPMYTYLDKNELNAAIIVRQNFASTASQLT